MARIKQKSSVAAFAMGAFKKELLDKATRKQHERYYKDF